MKVISSIVFSFIFLIQYQFAFPNNLSPVSKGVTFRNGNITLSGTLLLPEGKGPFPAIVFVHGSGPETRGNSLYSAKWLRSIGYAALIYDKRGTGKSGGKKAEITYFSFEDLANDVIAAVNFLSNQEIIDKTKIGLHASSQGGWVAPLAAVKSNLIRFMIIRSASVVTVSEDRIFERGERLRGEGFTEQEIKESSEMQLLEGKQTTSSDSGRFWQLLEKNKYRKWFKSAYGEDVDRDEIKKYRKWYATVADFDPVSYLQQIDIPIVWIFGDAKIDKFGPIEKSIENLQRLKNEGKDYLILQYDGEGHNINEAKYERALFDWLRDINQYNSNEFKKHEDTYK